MNWLAHIFLSEQNVDFQMGNYLADPLKGRTWDNASPNIIKGMKIHKVIDSYTDSHKLFIQSKTRLGSKGLLKPIIIDLTYDYLLTKNWNTFCTIKKDEFLKHFYTQTNKQLPYLPQKVSFLLERLIKYDILNQYQNLEQLKTAFERVDKRLSKRLLLRDQAVAYFDRVSEQIDEIETDFLLFFPMLCEKVRCNVNQKRLTHWKNLDVN